MFSPPQKNILNLIFLLVTIATLPVFAQQSPDKNNQKLSLHFNSYYSSNKNLPFWFTSNQNGIFTDDNNSYQILDFEFTKPFQNKRNWGFSYGSQMMASYSTKTKFLPIAYWAELKYNKLILSIGAKPDPIHYEGLSSTNANLMWSNNSRPLPHIQIRTNNFISIFSNYKKLLFKFIYEENFLFDRRYTEQTHLHHKSLFFKQIFNNQISITVGLDHWVFWGGTSPNYGKLPAWKSYFRYVFAMEGGSEAPETDQINASGNQLGNYHFIVEKQFNQFSLNFYWNHLFEDGSGKRFMNIKDGLWGLVFTSKKKDKTLNGILFEFMRTIHQSGSYHQIKPNPNFPGRPNGLGADNYFTHSVYKSGFTHFGRMMGTPFFIPYQDENGISMGFKSTRMWALHLGMKGTLFDHLNWQSMTSFSENYGTYSAPFPIPIKMFSYLLKLNYQSEKLPLNYELYFAGDTGNEIKNLFGLGFGVHYRIQ